MSPASKACFTFSKTDGSFWASSRIASPTVRAQAAVRRWRSADRSSGASRSRWRSSGQARRASVVLPVCREPCSTTSRRLSDGGRRVDSQRALRFVDIAAVFTANTETGPRFRLAPLGCKEGNALGGEIRTHGAMGSVAARRFDGSLDSPPLADG